MRREVKLGLGLELALRVRIGARLRPSWIGFRLGPILRTVDSVRMEVKFGAPVAAESSLGLVGNWTF